MQKGDRRKHGELQKKITARQRELMGELARLKDAGRIEAIRERNANYHVFVFVNGRPGDDLITASLDKAGAPVEEAHPAPGRPATRKHRARREKTKRANANPRRKRR